MIEVEVLEITDHWHKLFSFLTNKSHAVYFESQKPRMSQWSYKPSKHIFLFEVIHWKDVSEYPEFLSVVLWQSCNMLGIEVFAYLPCTPNVCITPDKTRSEYLNLAASRSMLVKFIHSRWFYVSIKTMVIWEFDVYPQHTVDGNLGNMRW